MPYRGHSTSVCSPQQRRMRSSPRGLGRARVAVDKDDAPLRLQLVVRVVAGDLLRETPRAVPGWPLCPSPAPMCPM